MKRHSFIYWSVVLLLVSCTSTDVLRLDETKRPPKQPSELHLLLEEPKQEYQTIALIEVSDQGWGLTLEQLKRDLLSKAAQIGGDAVIIGTKTEESATSFVPVGSTWVATQLNTQKMVGKVIVFQKTDK